MNMDEEEYSPYGYGRGCGIHGEDFLCECTLCGIEYCSACFRHSTLCADCAAQAAFDDEVAEPTEEEKDILLANEFTDDEPSELIDFESPAPPAKTMKEKAKAKTQAKPKAKAKAKTASKAKVKPKAKTKTKAVAKPKVKTKAKVKSAPQAKAKPRKATAKKRKA